MFNICIIRVPERKLDQMGQKNRDNGQEILNRWKALIHKSKKCLVKLFSFFLKLGVYGAISFLGSF